VHTSKAMSNSNSSELLKIIPVFASVHLLYMRRLVKTELKYTCKKCSGVVTRYKSNAFLRVTSHVTRYFNVDTVTFRVTVTQQMR